MTDPSPPSVTTSASTRSASAPIDRPVRSDRSLRLVVVDGQIGRTLDHRGELGAIEQRQALPRIEDERDARIGELARVRLHAFLAVGRDDPQRDIARHRSRGLTCE